MKLGFNQATCMKNSTLAADIFFAEECGYDYIEIRLDMLHDYLAHHRLNELADFFRTHHIKPYGFNSIEDINFCDRQQWQERLNQVAFACESARTIGGNYLVIVPTISANKRWSEQEIFADSVARLRELSEFVADYDMKLAFEPIGGQKCCVRSLAVANSIVEEVNRANVGLVIDAFNLYLDDGWRDVGVIDQVADEKIFIYHIDDADDLPIDKLEHCHRLFPGNGVIPLSAITAKLRQKNYHGICSLELFNPAYWLMDARDVFAIGARKTRAYLG